MPFRKHVFVCVSGSTCPGQGSEAVLVELRRQIMELGLRQQIRINKSGCFDQCGNGPMVVVYPDGIWYSHVTVADCQEIVQSHLLEDRPVERLFYDWCGKMRS